MHQILRYVKGTLGKGLHFKKMRGIEVHIGADLAGSTIDRRSTFGTKSKLEVVLRLNSD